MDHTTRPSYHAYWSWEGKFERLVLNNRQTTGDQSSANQFPTSRPLSPKAFSVYAQVNSDIDVDANPTQVPFNTLTLPSTATFPDAAPHSPFPAFPQAEPFGDLSTEFDVDEHSLSGSFDISLVSDTSEDTDPDTSLALDSSFFSSTPITPARVCISASSPTPLGLGISGLSKKDGSAFTGLGVVSSRFSPWRPSDQEETRSAGGPLTAFQVPHEETYSPRCDLTDPIPSSDSDSLSNTFLQETLLTFTDDPFHGYTLASIPECDSYFEINDLPPSRPSVSLWGTPTVTPSPSSGSGDRSSTGTLERARRKSAVGLSRNWSAPTISSELKRSGSAPASSVSFSPSSSMILRSPSNMKLPRAASTKRQHSPSGQNRPRSPSTKVLRSPTNMKPLRSPTHTLRSPGTKPLRSPLLRSPSTSSSRSTNNGLMRHSSCPTPTTRLTSKSPTRPGSTATRSPASSRVWRF
ncbi:uncharacterized protein LACBIDRAFT_310898 [Laccaria bicolor S238N-H82]|uniref:Predicted protein n=1 Tax=Laccaria bicolor (strain S238N-H82 / ATCC MYA-4686) TaxID=486041 RepID=B0DVC2_LACBS|nr:uncharacterized protein LACBIDRAFT_310898 [Laccaria bicolor S238N-H82]EDR01487.1 predicted protein [Laccaria bicolor S238N-H82]|eukprot:XP_001887839.1 predicted protein [Laccaria bicolor S238N-H82]